MPRGSPPARTRTIPGTSPAQTRPSRSELTPPAQVVPKHDPARERNSPPSKARDRPRSRGSLRIAHRSAPPQNPRLKFAPDVPPFFPAAGRLSHSTHPVVSNEYLSCTGAPTRSDPTRCPGDLCTPRRRPHQHPHRCRPRLKRRCRRRRRRGRPSCRIRAHPSPQLRMPPNPRPPALAVSPTEPPAQPAPHG